MKHPTLFLGATKDYVCVSAVGISEMERYSTDVTTEEMNTGHWIHIERPQEVNDSISRWLESKGL